MNEFYPERITIVPKKEQRFDLSVIVRFYNQEKFVDKILSSIFEQQTHYSFEVIIADDGSSDKTIVKVKEWQEKFKNRIKINIMERDNSLDYDKIIRASRNSLSALKLASGKYVCFIDGDDYFCRNDKFERQISLLEKYPKACACLSGYEVIEPDGSKRAKVLELFEKSKTINYIKYGFVHAASIIFRNHPIQCYDDNFDDYSMFVTFANTSTICNYNAPTFCYVKSDESSWSTVFGYKKKYVKLRNLNDSIAFSSRFKKAYLYRHSNLLMDLFEDKDLINFISPFSKRLKDYWLIKLLCLEKTRKKLFYKIILNFEFFKLRVERKLQKKKRRIERSFYL